MLTKLTPIHLTHPPPPPLKIITVYVNITVVKQPIIFSLAEKHIGITANHNHSP